MGYVDLQAIKFKVGGDGMRSSGLKRPSNWCRTMSLFSKKAKVSTFSFCLNVLAPILDGYSALKLLLITGFIEHHRSYPWLSEFTKPRFEVEEGPTRQLWVVRKAPAGVSAHLELHQAGGMRSNEYEPKRYRALEFDNLKSTSTCRFSCRFQQDMFYCTELLIVDHAAGEAECKAVTRASGALLGRGVQHTGQGDLGP
ncbi:hypothetical protein BDV93DRAFT_513070 [Ceratobasidium sp. AG-I]|nr:hypothetical protein BDV93DRAFT_513070 [Ceratobasidium sp. AG-I]